MIWFNFLYLFDILKYSSYLKYSGKGYDERPILNNDTCLSVIRQNLLKKNLLNKLEDNNVSIQDKLIYIKDSDLFYSSLSPNITRGLPLARDW
jgi:hypothetical protein